MRKNRIVVALLAIGSLLFGFSYHTIHAWIEVPPTIVVKTDAEDAVTFVDLLIPLNETPLLLDDHGQPVSHPLNGFRDAEGFGSATLYAEDCTTFVLDPATNWIFQLPWSGEILFKIIVIESDDQRYVSEPWTTTLNLTRLRWNDGVFRLLDPVEVESPSGDGWIGWDISIAWSILAIVALILVEIPFLKLFGYRSKRTLRTAILAHGFVIGILAVVNRLYHVQGTMTMLLVVCSTLFVLSISEAVWFGLRLKEHSPSRAVFVSLSGTTISTILLFLLMSTWSW